jgi:hypothetical protein
MRHPETAQPSSTLNLASWAILEKIYKIAAWPECDPSHNKRHPDEMGKSEVEAFASGSHRR